jgi:hypothetical protein
LHLDAVATTALDKISAIAPPYPYWLPDQIVSG